MEPHSQNYSLLGFGLLLFYIFWLLLFGIGFLLLSNFTTLIMNWDMQKKMFFNEHIKPIPGEQELKNIKV